MIKTNPQISQPGFVAGTMIVVKNMARIFLCVCVLSLVFRPTEVAAQKAWLFLKKGPKKKRTWLEGDRIMLRLPGDTIVGGLITHLRDDTIYLLGKPIPVAKVEAVVLRQKGSAKLEIPFNKLLIITGGVVLTTVGLTLSGQVNEKEALTAGLTIGYGPLLVMGLVRKIKAGRREFRLGKKFRLQLLDIHDVRRRAF
jgi:hypothetical protein